MSFLYSLAALTLLIFTVYTAIFIWRTVDEIGLHSGIALGGGLLASAFVQLSALSLWLLTRPHVIEVQAILFATHDLAYLTGGPAHVLAFAPFIGASSIALWNRSIFPQWIAWIGIAAAGLSLLSVTALLWVPATLLLPAGRAFSFLWILAICALVLVRKEQFERWQHRGMRVRQPERMERAGRREK